ncbi:PTS system fructose-specific IIC component [Mycoplasmoides fastidiosum]|uniref:PTS system fructose-specific IIC component n=1 Tax=Mycoplasmoides fastidiosum TaxID=92758 RepID=A0ABU0LZS8_9BACT|nr:fructose-specific PTS transporter subunit EIIC [Mycoplasmoides fastidiosum]MDQ0514210.1 PTS system fructose-specific IIC component [Mycoplasmoides fastidiosum]UUD37381.1 fructose-specific PTS transporter subunit EIIC [Mycoplasmoides fastidiosum]
MKISQLLKSNLIFVDTKFGSKQEALKFFSNQLVLHKYGRDSETIYQLFQDRENQASTGMGDKLAIPHILHDVMTENVIFFAKTTPVDWAAIDNQKVELIFGIAMTKTGGHNQHIDALMQLSNLLLNEKNREKLLTAKNKNDVLAVIETAETDASTPVINNDPNAKYDVVAVTSCPTGIAHTFLAAKALENYAKEANVRLKVETQGTEGSKNSLTQAEIDNAGGIILAIDRSIDTSRFAKHTNVVETTTRKAIYEPAKLFDQVKNRTGVQLKNITSGGGLGSDDSRLSFDGFGKKAYRSLLTGVSYMLPFVIFGGILIALGFIIDLAQLGVQGQINAIDANFGKMFATSRWFNTIGGEMAFGLIVPILSAYITFAMVGKIGLLPGFMVGLISNGSMNKLLSTINAPEAITGVSSGFFGAIGGAFLAAAIIILLTNHVFNRLPKNAQGITNILIMPLFGTLLIVAIFWFANIPFQYLSYGFSQMLGAIDANSQYIGFLLGLIIGVMMATDLGGPINKAAYIFGTFSLAEAVKNGSTTGSLPMGIAIITGMIPPLGIALSTIVSKKYWSDEDRKAAQSNWILGLSFISEGAIPFTAARPQVMVLANIIGGGSAGLISGALGINALAPHGGIFILPLFRSTLFSGTNLQIGFGILFTILALIIGTLTQAVALHFLLKNESKIKIFYQRVGQKLRPHKSNPIH